MRARLLEAVLAACVFAALPCPPLRTVASHQGDDAARSIRARRATQGRAGAWGAPARLEAFSGGPGDTVRPTLMPAAIRLVAPTAPARSSRQAPVPAAAASAKPIDVPQGNGAPVITEGTFSPGEWDDAMEIRLSEDGAVTLHVKEYRGVVFIGVRGRGSNAIGPSELSLAVLNGPIRKLHVSYGLYELLLPATGPEPRARLGFTTDWYANEFRRDEEEFARLQKDGLDPREIMRAASYPCDGIEFAIRRSKLPGRVWLVRLSVSAFVAGKPGMLTYPRAAAERATDGWLQLRFK